MTKRQYSSPRWLVLRQTATGRGRPGSGAPRPWHLPVAPLVRDLIPPQSVPRGECGDVDAPIGERLIDVLAELFTFAVS